MSRMVLELGAPVGEVEAVASLVVAPASDCGAQFGAEGICGARKGSK